MIVGFALLPRFHNLQRPHVSAEVEVSASRLWLDECMRLGASPSPGWGFLTYDNNTVPKVRRQKVCQGVKDDDPVVAFSTRVFLSNTLCCRPIIVISPSIQILGITGIERYPIPVAAHRIYGLEDTVVQWALSCFHPAFVRYPSLECFWKGGPGPAEPSRLCT